MYVYRFSRFVYVYMYAHTHIYMYTYIYIYIHTHTHTYIKWNSMNILIIKQISKAFLYKNSLMASLVASLVAQW